MTPSRQAALVPGDAPGSWDLIGDGYTVALDRDGAGVWTFWQVDVVVSLGRVLDLGDKGQVPSGPSVWLEEAWQDAGGRERDKDLA